MRITLNTNAYSHLYLGRAVVEVEVEFVEMVAAVVSDAGDVGDEVAGDEVTLLEEVDDVDELVVEVDEVAIDTSAATFNVASAEPAPLASPDIATTS